MATDFSTMEFDPATGTTKRKKPTNLPYLNPNPTSQGYLPYSPYTPEGVQQGNTAVMGAAQTAAMAQPKGAAIQDQTTAMTQKLMTDPNMGRDWQKYNKGMLSKFDADRASGVQQYKEANQGMGGAGQVQQGIVDLALQRSLDRGLYENELENTAYEKERQNYLDALGEGRTQVKDIDLAQQNYLNNLLDTHAEYEGQRSQESGQKFTTSERKDTQVFQSDEAKAEREWNTLERMDTQQFQGYEADLNRQLELAKQKNDIELTKKLESDKNNLALTMQTNGMNHDQAMETLKASLAEARAAGDAQRTKDIMDKQAEIDEKEDIRTFGHETSLTVYNRGIDQAIEDGRLKMADKELAQRALEFSDELSWNKEATKLGIDAEDRKLLWQEAENARDRQAASQLQQIQNAFTQKGWNYEFLVSAADMLPKEQLADFIKEAAKVAGVTHTEIDAAGNEVQVSGFKTAGSTFIDEAIGKITRGENLNTKEIDTVKAKMPELEDLGMAIADKGIESLVNKPDSGPSSGKWAEENAGQLYEASNGRIYTVVGPAKKDALTLNKPIGVIFKDQATGETFNLEDVGGFPAG